MLAALGLVAMLVVALVILWLVILCFQAVFGLIDMGAQALTVLDTNADPLSLGQKLGPNERPVLPILQARYDRAFAEQNRQIQDREHARRAQHAADMAAMAAEVARQQQDQAPPPAPPIYFKPGEPRTFQDYLLQSRITDMLAVQIQAMPDDLCRLRPQIFLGPAGLGKTLLAKVCAEELRLRNLRLGLPEPVFIEVFPADMSSVADLDAVVARAADAPAAVLFIDEVHGLDGTHAHKLYELLENGRYPFHGEPTPEALPNVTLLAATTDFGKMHAALRRRWVKHYLEPASEEQLAELLYQRGPIDQPAIDLIVSRTKFSGAPWEAVELFELAKTVALSVSKRLFYIVLDDVNWVLQNQQIDELGLRALDRRVIQVLRDRRRTVGGETVYGASEGDLCVLAGIDKAEYRETVRPRLMARGLLEIRPGVGQALTARALELYPVPSA